MATYSGAASPFTVKYSSATTYSSTCAFQGNYGGGGNLVGVIYFPNLPNIDADAIDSFKLNLTFGAAGHSGTGKHMNFYAAKQSGSVGEDWGEFYIDRNNPIYTRTGQAYNNSVTLTETVLLSAILSNKTLCIYRADGAASSGASSNYAQISTATLEIEYSDAAVYYGVSGSWKKCEAYYGMSGSWKKCEIYYGANSAWKKCGG